MRRILIGCGIACLVVIVMLVVGGIAVGSWVRSQVDTKQVESLHAELEKRFGSAESWVPPLDGKLDPARVALFAAVRDSIAAGRRVAAADFSTFMHVVGRNRPEGRPALEKLLDVVSTARNGTTMATSMVKYFTTQERVLLDNGMGPGEYRYLYCTAYFAWLQWDPMAKPEVRDALQRANMLQEVETARARYGRLLRGQLENQRRDLEAKTVRTPAEDAELSLLKAELEDVAKTERFPFIGRLPATTTAALEPHRARLEATLPQDAAEIALDLFRAARKRGGGFNIDFDDRSGSAGRGTQ